MQISCPRCTQPIRIDSDRTPGRGRCAGCGMVCEAPTIAETEGDAFELAGTLPSGAAIAFTLRATDAAAAAEAATAQGVKVRSVMPASRSSLEGAAVGKAQAATEDIWRQPGDDPADESIAWSGTPSQWTNAHIFLIAVLLCWLIVPIFWAIWRYAVVRCTRYELTTQRLRLITGVFNKSVDELELYRVRDTTLVQPFIQRIVNLGSIIIISADVTDPTLTIRAISSPREVREQLRALVERRRRVTRARNLEMD